MNNDTGRYRIVIVDDHPILREGLAQYIAGQPDFEVIGHAESAPGALELIKKTQPDGMILDISLKDSDGIETTRQVKEALPNIKIVVLSMHDENMYALRAVRAGASGYIMKQEAPEQIVAALRKVFEGELYLSPVLKSQLLGKLRFGVTDRKLSGSPAELLSPRELSVFELIGEGRSTREIAGRLNLSSKTIETHRMNIRNKLHCRNGNEMVHLAIQWQNEKSGKAVT
jgi:DNA-binding NarL/FixJ family response regulator